VFIGSVRNQPFSLHIGKDTAAREIIKAPSEKADIGDYFAVFPPLPRSFWSVWKDGGDRQLKPPGNSACRGRRSPYRVYCTGGGHSLPGRMTIPATTFYSCS